MGQTFQFEFFNINYLRVDNYNGLERTFYSIKILQNNSTIWQRKYTQSPYIYLLQAFFPQKTQFIISTTATDNHNIWMTEEELRKKRSYSKYQYYTKIRIARNKEAHALKCSVTQICIFESDSSAFLYHLCTTVHASHSRHLFCWTPCTDTR